ncbi:MAG: hypothetical protein HY288_18475 [Planctomycetia bacterium]|nr:hypothetical protein [Planctomycetia bacterium]
MRLFENETFHRFRDDDSGAVFSDLEFHNCIFRSCQISNTHSPALRTIVRNIRAIGCHQFACCVLGAIVEDVFVDGLKTHGETLQTWGTVFKHVTLRGKIDILMTSSLIFGGQATPVEQQAFDRANDDYYRSVDWALDISQGDFKDLDIRGVPGRLIKRDHETQALLTRQAMLDGKWRNLEFHTNITSIGISLCLDRGEPDLVLVAPKRDNTFRERLADIELLRRAGIAEPD